ncbi:MAG: hypothetical protein RR851_15105 [Clostridium sp.]
MIKELKLKETITIEDTNADLNNAIAISEFQLQSYSKLFQSYLNNKNEVANEFNLQRFLNEYSNKCAEIETFRLELLKDVLKDEYKILVENNFGYFIDYMNRTIRITKGQ